MEDQYSNIRQVLGKLVGKKLIDITQHDEQEYHETGACYVMLMFEDGNYVKFFIGDDGFEHSEGTELAKLD